VAASETTQETEETRGAGVRWRIIRPLFETLYRNRYLYWLASTIPFAGQWRTWQRLVIPRLVGQRVLETGCGIGTLLSDMAKAGYTCAAIERSPQMVAATRDRLRREGLFDKATVTQGSVQHMPYADAAFDSVVSTFPTEYIVDPATTREMARVLRPGGRVIVVMGAALLPANLLLLPLVGLQTLVYGRARRSTSSGQDTETNESAASPAQASTNIEVRGDLLLERMRAAGFVAHAERVKGPFWVALLYIGEKPDEELKEN